MTRLGLIFLLLLLTTIHSSANSQEKQARGNLVFYFDQSHFKYFQDEGKTYFQFFFYVPRNQLKFQPKDSFYIGQLQTRVVWRDLADTNRQEVRQFVTTVDERITATDTAADVPVLYESNFAVVPSRYILQITITDLNDTNRRGMQQTTLEIPSYQTRNLQISDIQIVSQIRKSDQPDELFYKNGFAVIPNPSKIFGTNLPRLFLYAEIYNLKTGAKSSGKESYTAEFIITDEAGSVVKEMPAKTYKKSAESAVLMHSFNIISLPSGRYYLMVRIKDPADQSVTMNKKMFIVYHEGEALSEITDTESFFKDLDMVGMELAENVVYYLMSDQERKIFLQLDMEGKKKYLDRFWKERDPSPGTRANENLVEYYKRYAEANQRFSTPNRQGWKTDMGRVYIIYGPPAQIEKHDFEPKILPYQRWYYYQLKDQPTQTEFVFADKDGTGIYRLIHSNARGELSNRNWMKDIQTFETGY